MQTHLERDGQILHIDLAVQIGGAAAVGGHLVGILYIYVYQSLYPKLVGQLAAVNRIHRKTN